MSDHYSVPCEYNESVRPATRCNAPSMYRYPAMGGGWCYLCDEHGAKHARYSQHVTLGAGERLRNAYPKGYEDWYPESSR